MGSAGPSSLLRVISGGVKGVFGVFGESITGDEAINPVGNQTSSTVGACAGGQVQVWTSHGTCGDGRSTWLAVTGLGPQVLPGVKAVLSSSSLED